MASDIHFMNRCIALGKLALERGEAPVGSILVKEGKVIAEGIEAGKEQQDITCHAEMEVIRAARREGVHDFSQAILYTTHEPCIMCSYVIRHHRISKVVVGTQVPFIGGTKSPFPILLSEKIPHWGPPPMLITGVLESECEALNHLFLSKKK